MKRQEPLTVPRIPPWRAAEKDAAINVATRCLYVRVDTGATTIKFVGSFVVQPGTAFNVTIRIWDNRLAAFVLRLAYAGDGFTPIMSGAPMLLTITGKQLP